VIRFSFGSLIAGLYQADIGEKTWDLGAVEDSTAGTFFVDLFGFGRR